MAQRVETVGVVKARADVLTTLPLAVLAGAVTNLVLVTAGNIIGGTILVALVYWFVYLRSERPAKSATTK